LYNDTVSSATSVGLDYEFTVGSISCIFVRKDI